ncbi:hypothetical protein [Streptomyces aureocirculatus]|uniref:hypothetical protein n=1 Tax=Streptomyces aureocirculatus TaxID=67275 RepID=UPI00068E0EDE|nr:hypothetical protein [Streptomyces aureocirculatus]
MPIYLHEPTSERPRDGKGYNRLSLNAHMGAGGAQCALRPTSYATLFESYDTRRARWGGFGSCPRAGACETCSLLNHPLSASPRPVPFNAAKVLVRIDTRYPDSSALSAAPTTRLWMTDDPDDACYRDHGQIWNWFSLRHLKGWELGRTYRDEIGNGFWLHRTPDACTPHVQVRARQRPSSTRHAFVVGTTRAALLTCFGRCLHSDGRLLNVIGHHVPAVVDDGVLPLHPTELHPPHGAVRSRHLELDSHWGACTLVLRQERTRLAQLSFDGSTWTPAQIRGAAAALLAHTEE